MEFVSLRREPTEAGFAPGQKGEVSIWLVDQGGSRRPEEAPFWVDSQKARAHPFGEAKDAPSF